MREQIENRLQSLMAERKIGQEMLAEAEIRQTNLRMTLTRISGAIRVLEELLQGNNSDTETTKPAESAKTRVAA